MNGDIVSMSPDPSTTQGVNVEADEKGDGIIK